MTDVIMASLEEMAKTYGIPVLPAVRTDSVVTKSTRSKQFLADYDPKCKAAEDYKLVAGQLLDHLKGQLNERQSSLPAGAQA